MIVPRGILALSLAVVFLAATASSASTTPTPPPPPLTLDVQSSLGSAFPHEKLIFHATTSNDSTLVATGRKIKKTTTQLVADEQTKITVRLKHKQQLRKQSLPPPPKPKVKIKFAATDEFGQTATDALALRILVQGGGGVIVIKELS
jgi:cytoskeletal protein RodZ